MTEAHRRPSAAPELPAALRELVTIFSRVPGYAQRAESAWMPETILPALLVRYCRYLARVVEQHTSGRRDRGAACVVLAARFHALLDAPQPDSLAAFIRDARHGGLFPRTLATLAESLRTGCFSPGLGAVVRAADARGPAVYRAAAERLLVLLKRAPFAERSRRRRA